MPHSPPLPKPSPTINRRFLLASLSMASFSAATLISPLKIILPVQAAAPNSDPAFLALSRFLTSKPTLDPLLADRVLSQLTALDVDFPAHQADLAQAIQGKASMDVFLASPEANNPQRRATIKTILSAWYLGFTGTPIVHRAVDNTSFVTFTGALIYPPTLSATVIPSYSRAGPNYWSEPPPPLAASAPDSNLRQWGKNSPKGTGPIPGAAAFHQ